MKKLIIIAIITTIIFGIGSYSILSFIKSIKEDTKNTNINIEKIDKNYKEILEKIDIFNESRSDLMDLLENVYTNNLKEKYNNIINLIQSEDDSVNDIKILVSTLDNLCPHDYINSKAKKECSLYQDYFEQMTNVLITDTNKINELINKYNANYEDKLEIYNSKSNDEYIDYNKDGKYLGRENE